MEADQERKVMRIIWDTYCNMQELQKKYEKDSNFSIIPSDVGHAFLLELENGGFKVVKK